MPLDSITGVFFDCVYPDYIDRKTTPYWTGHIKKHFPESISADDAHWSVSRWGSFHWGKGVPFDPTPESGIFQQYYPDAPWMGRRFMGSYLAARDFSEAAVFSDMTKPEQNAVQFPPVFQDRVLPSPRRVTPHLYEYVWWRPLTPTAVWTEPALSVVSSSWTEPALTVVSSTWTEPAITPIVSQD